MGKPITMKQVADNLGISVWTVSMVLNNRARRRGISVSTIKKVQAYMDEKGYVPSRQAVALKSGSRTNVGILHCGHLYSHLTEAFNLVSDHVNHHPESVEYQIVSRPQLSLGVQELLSRRVSKLVWIHTQHHGME